MNYRLNVTPGAIADIEEIRAYVAVNSETAAERLTSRLERTIGRLTFMPNRHPFAPEASTHRREIRQAFSGKYRILFWATGDIVHVLRVRHTSRQPFSPGELS